MARTIFLLAALVASVSIAAQQPMSPNQAQGAPQTVISVNPPPAMVVAGSGLYGPSVFMAPSAGFATPQAAAGATQSGFISGSAGVSLNAPAYLGVTSTLGPVPLVYEGGQPGYAYAPGGFAGAPAEATTGRLINDMGPSSYAGTFAPEANGTVVNLSPPPPPAVSLGEVAASYRAVPLHPVRIYANAAGEQLERTYVVTGAAIASNVTPEKFIVLESPPSQTPAPLAQEVNPPQALAAYPAQAQPVNPPQAQAANPQQGQEMAANTVPPPPIAPPAQTETKQEPTRLPATSTLLPLLGLLGLASGAVGLWLRKARR